MPSLGSCSAPRLSTDAARKGSEMRNQREEIAAEQRRRNDLQRQHEAARLAEMLEAIPGGDRMVVEMMRQGHASPDYATAVQQCHRAQQGIAQQQGAQDYHAQVEAAGLGWARSLTQQDLQTIAQLEQSGGWQAVTEAMLTPGVHPHVADLLTSTRVANGGTLAGLSQAVTERIQSDDRTARVQHG